MNTLLANGEVPGLFEGDEHAALLTACKEGSQREGLLLDTSDELYRWFTNQVMRNLHVVFTMNPSSSGLRDRAATSPALFNRCVLDWFGDWSDHAFFQVGLEFTNRLDLDDSNYTAPDFFPAMVPECPQPPTHRHAVVNAFVFVHHSVSSPSSPRATAVAVAAASLNLNPTPTPTRSHVAHWLDRSLCPAAAPRQLRSAAERVLRREGRSTHVTPRHYLDFINHYVSLLGEKRSELEEQQLHLNVGLNKIKETVEQVAVLSEQLGEKEKLLSAKNELANQKLKQMVQDQQEAEAKKATSVEIQAQLEVKEKEVEESKKVVMEGKLASKRMYVDE